MKFTPRDIPDLTGRVAVVTGANSGLGLATAWMLAGAGARVIMTARSREKFEMACAEAMRRHPQAHVAYQELDLADLEQIAEAATSLRERVDRIDILVNNAGVMMTPELRTPQGLELQIGTNHFGHFAWTGRLLDRLLAADSARVVTVSSGMHHLGRVDLDDLHFEHGRRYDPTAAYDQSKLANLMFALELQRRFERGGVPARSVAAHPGYTRTNLQKAGVQMEGGGLFHTVADYGMRVLNRVIAQDVDEGALPQVYAAVTDVRGGTYWGPTGLGELRGGVGRARINPKARNEDKARRLWEISVATTGVGYEALGSRQG